MHLKSRAIPINRSLEYNPKCSKYHKVVPQVSTARTLKIYKKSPFIASCYGKNQHVIKNTNIIAVTNNDRYRCC